MRVFARSDVPDPRPEHGQSKSSAQVPDQLRSFLRVYAQKKVHLLANVDEALSPGFSVEVRRLARTTTLEYDPDSFSQVRRNVQILAFE